MKSNQDPEKRTRHIRDMALKHFNDAQDLSEAGDVESLADQVPAHRPPHAAQPDDADAFDLSHAPNLPSPVFRPPDIAAPWDDPF